MSNLVPWWRNAVIYQVYPRSFADGNGDGIGDLIGLRARLGAIAELGVDAIWLSPFYRSPQVDAGYDVSDHRDVDPLFGSLDDADALLAEAHELGLRVIVDLVPNHTSSEHPWFRAAVASPDAPERGRYIFRPGRGGGRRAAAQRLGQPLRRTGLGPGLPCRRAAQLVPAPLRRRATRSGLDRRRGP